MTKDSVNVENFIKKYQSLIYFIYKKHFGACIKGATKEDILSHGLEAIDRARKDFCEDKGSEVAFVYGYVFYELNHLKTFYMRKKRRSFADISIYTRKTRSNGDFIDIESSYLGIEDRDLSMVDIRLDIEKAKEKLKAFEKDVVDMVLQGYSLYAISQKYQKSKQYVAQVFSSAKEKMKPKLEKMVV